MEVFYKVVIEWCKYPFHNEIEDKYAEFFIKNKKKYLKLHSLKIGSNTTIKQKLNYLKENYSEKVIKVIKMK